MSLYTDLLSAGLPVVSASETQATFTRSLNDAEWEIVYNFIEPARPAKLATEIADRQQIKDEYTSTLQALSDIENATSPTNAQVIAAMKYLAGRQKIIFKLMARLL